MGALSWWSQPSLCNIGEQKNLVGRIFAYSILKRFDKGKFERFYIILLFW